MKTIARLPLAQLSADETHVEAFKALAHLSRLQVFFLLVKAGQEMSVGEIQEAVEIPGPTLSHHLDILRRAGLLETAGCLRRGTMRVLSCRSGRR